MGSNLDLEREKRFHKTGKWFEGSSSANQKDLYLVYGYVHIAEDEYNFDYAVPSCIIHICLVFYYHNKSTQ